MVMVVLVTVRKHHHSKTPRALAFGVFIFAENIWHYFLYTPRTLYILK